MNKSQFKSTSCQYYLILNFLQFNCSNLSFPNIGYPLPGYSDELDCRWFIEVDDPSAILEIAINRIRMEQNCKYDRLEIYEGGCIEKFTDQTKRTSSNRYFINQITLHTGGEMMLNNSVEVLCGIVDRRDHKMIRVHNPKATLRLITDDKWTEEGFELTVRPSKFLLSLWVPQKPTYFSEQNVLNLAY